LAIEKDFPDLSDSPFVGKLMEARMVFPTVSRMELLSVAQLELRRIIWLASHLVETRVDLKVETKD
jgi:hypothetical protein